MANPEVKIEKLGLGQLEAKIAQIEALREKSKNTEIWGSYTLILRIYKLLYEVAWFRKYGINELSIQ